MNAVTPGGAKKTYIQDVRWVNRKKQENHWGEHPNVSSRSSIFAVNCTQVEKLVSNSTKARSSQKTTQIHYVDKSMWPQISCHFWATLGWIGLWTGDYDH